MIDCCAFSYFTLFLLTRKKLNTQNLKLMRNRFKELTDGPHCIDPESFRIDRDPMFRSSPRILPPFVAILASTWRYIVENLPKIKLSNQNNSRHPNSAQTLLKQLKILPPELRKSAVSSFQIIIFLCLQKKCEIKFFLHPSSQHLFICDVVVI